MRIVLEKVIDNKLAQLVLLNDNSIVKVLYNGVCIDSSEGNTWNNMKDEDLLDSYLDLIVESYLTKARESEEFNKLCEELGWEEFKDGITQLVLSTLVPHKYLKSNLDLTEKGKMLLFLLRNYVFSKEVLL